jgi:hypothetical protein
VKVTAQSGAAKSYIVTVTRAAGMANLTLSSGTLSPTFDWRTEDYAASVGNETRSLRVTPTAAGATILVDVNNAVAGAVLSGRTSFPLPLNVGENTITFSVTSLDGTSTKNYRVKVTRAPSAVADLRVLTVRGGTLDPVFNSATSNYTMAVGASTASVRVRPYVTEANASIQVRVNGGAFTTLPNRWLSAALPVNPGANTVEIVVTAQDGTTNKTYTINVTRGT